MDDSLPRRWGVVKRLVVTLTVMLIASVMAGCAQRSQSGTSEGQAVAAALKVAEEYNQRVKPMQARLDLSQGRATTTDDGEGWYVSFPYEGGGGGMTWKVHRQSGKVDESPMTWDPPKKP